MSTSLCLKNNDDQSCIVDSMVWWFVGETMSGLICEVVVVDGGRLMSCLGVSPPTLISSLSMFDRV